mmetsp:Transcript_18586/g.43676  ORF Transcript_18586/g.43676 Transcript_18586/m.43676 type:complete len:132 (+) Transcript_18586:891-1286(+)
MMVWRLLAMWEAVAMAMSNSRGNSVDFDSVSAFSSISNPACRSASFWPGLDTGLARLLRGLLDSVKESDEPQVLLIELDMVVLEVVWGLQVDAVSFVGQRHVFAGSSSVLALRSLGIKSKRSSLAFLRTRC